MKGSPKIIHLTLLATLLICTAGIFRHDVAESAFLKLAMEPQFQCVGQLKGLGEGGGSASCVLISEKLVLTAAHCIMAYRQKDSTALVNNQKADILITTDGYIPDNQSSKFVVQFGSQQYKIKNIRLHPEYNWKRAHDYDIVVLELEEPVKGIKPAILYKGQSEQGKIAVGVGFGVSGSSNELKSLERLNKKIAGENTIDSIGGYYIKDKTKYGMLFTDFDHPTDPKYNELGSSKPVKFEYAPTGGDSGGGLFIKSDNEWQLAGLMSKSSINIQSLVTNKNYYGCINGYTRVSAHLTWIGKEAGL